MILVNSDQLFNDALERAKACAPRLVNADDYDEEQARQDAIGDVERCFPKIARGLFDQRDEIEGHIKNLARHKGLDTTALHRAKDALEMMGAIFQSADFQTINLASQAFYDSTGDLDKALTIIKPN